MWILNNSELEEETYTRKSGLGLLKAKEYRFSLVKLNPPIINNTNTEGLLLNPSDVIQRNITPLTPSSTGYFFLIEDLALDIPGLTLVSDSDLVITPNTYYINYGNKPYTLVHSVLDNITSFSYTFNFINPGRNIDYEYVINLTNFAYKPETINRISVSGIDFYDIAASQGCPNYFTYTNNQLVLKGCESCRPKSGDTGVIYGTRNITDYDKYKCFKFDFPTDVTFVKDLTYKGVVYNATIDIVDRGLLFSSELNSCICLKLI